MADVLVEQRDISAAIVCYLISQNFKEVLDIWRRRAIHHVNRKESTREQALVDLLQKFILLKLAFEQGGSGTQGIDSNADFNQVLVEVAGYLTSDEQAAISFMKYLTMSKNASIEVKLLSEQLYRANEMTMQNRVQQQ